MGKFVVKLKRHSSPYETDQGEKPRKVLFTGVRTVGLPVHRQKSSHRRLAQLVATMFQRTPQACIRLMTLGTCARSLSERDGKLYCKITELLHLHTIYLWCTQASKSDVSKRQQLEEEFKLLAYNEIHKGSFCKCVQRLHLMLSVAALRPLACW